MLHSLPYLLLENFQSCRPASFGEAMPVFQYTCDDGPYSGRFDFIGKPGRPVLYHFSNCSWGQVFVGYEVQSEKDREETERLLAAFSFKNEPSYKYCPGGYQLRQVRMYLRAGGNPNPVGREFPREHPWEADRRSSLLQTAICHNQARIVYLLIRHRCDVNQRDEQGRSAYDGAGVCWSDAPWEWPRQALIRLMLRCAGAKSTDHNPVQP